jgi:hypothetical protein
VDTYIILFQNLSYSRRSSITNTTHSTTGTDHYFHSIRDVVWRRDMRYEISYLI